MAFEQPCFKVTSFKAEKDLSTKQFYAVEISAADQVDVADAATDKVIGLMQNKPAAAGAAAEIAVLGVAKGVAGGSVSVGDLVGTDANGKLVAKTTDKDWILGMALEAGADGTVIAVLLTGPFTLSTT